MPSTHFAFDALAVDYDIQFTHSGIGILMRQAVWRRLDLHFRPGALAFLCVMGPLVPWEWGWYLCRGEPGTAFRRMRPGGVAWRGLTIRYPSIRALRRALSPAFRLRRASAIGVLLPPTYAEG